MTDFFWLAPQVEQLRHSRAAGRLAHALLVHDKPGGGGAWLAMKAAQANLCREPDAPCGRCKICQAVTAGRHPDLYQVGPIEDSRQIRIDQIRELTEQLTLTGYSSAASTAIIAPAEVMLESAANALLKSLEEPRPGVTLVLVTTSPSRLLPTVRSRCQRLDVTLPARAPLMAWLRAERGEGPWEAVLDVLGNAPLLALEADAALVLRVREETVAALEKARRGELDIPGTAERWVREGLSLRLACFENWVTQRVAEQIRPAADVTDLRTSTHLPAPAARMNIAQLIRLIDGLHELGRLAFGSLNKGLDLEQLLWRVPRIGSA
jgi:DNA polymerase III subunit delta'